MDVGVEREVHFRRLFEVVIRLIPSLSRREQEVFTLRALGGLEYPDIASILDIEEVTVRRFYSLARRRLVDLLQGELGVDILFPE